MNTYTVITYNGSDIVEVKSFNSKEETKKYCDKMEKDFHYRTTLYQRTFVLENVNNLN